MSDPETYDVLAVRYCHREDRQRYETFIANAWTDPVHDARMPIAYYVWAIVNQNRTIVVDTGFDRDEAAGRRRDSGEAWRPEFVCLPTEGLAMAGIDSRTVEDVIITHMHFDHAGTLDAFPRARFHLQELEMAYATGPYMAHDYFAGAYTVEHVVALVRHVFAGRVAFYDGDTEIAPGITVHRIGGHTMGMQCVRVLTKRGWVVLASDGSHFYDNFQNMAPYPIVHDVGAMLEGFRRLERLAASPRHVIPGHDPLVMARYPSPSADLEDVVARLDVDPSG
jgi:glyoxylase-like metal-dependent hydrolase (beta-lactamase superfamily II)